MRVRRTRIASSTLKRHMKLQRIFRVWKSCGWATLLATRVCNSRDGRRHLVDCPGGRWHSCHTDRIERVGAHEFRIRAAFEEGGPTCAEACGSRVDLLCRNAGGEPAKVTVHLDLSGDGKRTDYDTKPESGMKQRHFLFSQPPGRDWQQVDGATDGWTCMVSFEAVPGETKVGLSPWYTYGDYLPVRDQIAGAPASREGVARQERRRRASTGSSP